MHVTLDFAEQNLIEGESIKKSASTVLGRGYDRSQELLLERAFDVDLDGIDIIQEYSTQVQTYGNSIENTISDLNHNFGLKLNTYLHFPVNLEASLHIGHESSTGNESEIIVCSFVNFKQARCSLKKVSSSVTSEIGNSFVKSCLVRVGYHVHVIVENTSINKYNSSDWHAGLSLGIVSMNGLNAFCEGLEERLNKNKNLRIVVQAAGKLMLPIPK